MDGREGVKKACQLGNGGGGWTANAKADGGCAESSGF